MMRVEGLDPVSLQLFLSVAVLLACVLCLGCLILVIVTIRLVVLSSQVSPPGVSQVVKGDHEAHERKIIKALSDTLQKLSKLAHVHRIPELNDLISSISTLLGSHTSTHQTLFDMASPLQVSSIDTLGLYMRSLISCCRMLLLFRHTTPNMTFSSM